MRVEQEASVGERLRLARENAGLSASAAADLIGVHENTIYSMEKDAEARQLQLVRKAAETYGMTMGDLFGAPSSQVPTELRPMLEPLLPFTLERRISIVRNIASNLRFMWANVAGTKDSDVTNDTGPSVLVSSLASTSAKDDELEEIAVPLPRSGASSESMETHARQTAGKRIRGRHGSTQSSKPKSAKG